MTIANSGGGVPSELLLPSDYITVRLGLVDAVGLDAALLLERVRWRGEIREDGWVATYADLGEETRLSHRRVKTAVAVLRDRGWLLSENAGEGTRTLRWQVVVDPSGRNVPMGDPSGRSVPTKGPKRPVAPIEDLEDKDTPLPPTGGEVLPGLMVSVQDAETAFAEWWSHYPRKDDRKTALRAYRTARRRASAQTLLDGLLAHLPAYAAMKADPDRRTYIPLASTWLNKERWLNDPPEARAPRRGAFDFTPEEMADIEARVAAYGVTR